MIAKKRLKQILARVVLKLGPLDTPCWVWPGCDSGNGYGRVSVEGKMRSVHIVLYEALVALVPSGHFLDHKCRVRCCCNPWHVVPRTPRENTLLGEGPTAVNAKKTHCKRGHELEGANLISRERNGRNSRECRQCARLRKREKPPTSVRKHPL